MIVAVQVGPHRRIGIEIFPATDIPQHSPFSCGDDDGLAFEPIAHLSERMPDEAMIELAKWMHRASTVKSLHRHLSAARRWPLKPCDSPNLFNRLTRWSLNSPKRRATLQYQPRCGRPSQSLAAVPGSVQRLDS